jgi:hypothetical protein
MGPCGQEVVAMNTSKERTDENFPDTITFAVLTVDGQLRFDSTPSNPEFKEEGGWVTLYHHGPWDAIRETIGGPCPRLDRAWIGNGLIAWVSDESLLRPDAYPPNEIGGRTVNILTAFAQGIDAEPSNDPWVGPSSSPVRRTTVTTAGAASSGLSTRSRSGSSGRRGGRPAGTT